MQFNQWVFWSLDIRSPIMHMTKVEGLRSESDVPKNIIDKTEGIVPRFSDKILLSLLKLCQL